MDNLTNAKKNEEAEETKKQIQDKAKQSVWGAPGQRAGRIAWRHSKCFTPEELEDIEVLKGKRLTIDQPIF